MQIIKKFDKQANYIFYLAIFIHILVMCVELGEWSIPYRGRLIQVAFLLCCIKIMLSFYTKIEWLLMVILGLLGMLSYSYSGEKYILYVVVLIFAARFVDMNKVLKAILYSVVIVTVVTALLSIAGIGGTVVDVRDYGRGMIESRYCFGFGHPNNIHGTVWLMVSIAVWVYKDRFDWKHYSVFTVLNILLYAATVSKTGFAVTQCVLIGGILYRYANKYVFGKCWSYICGAVIYIGVLAITVASVIVCGWRGYGPILGLVDRLTTGRVSLAYKYARISWWHVWTKGGISNPIIDNGFASLGINYGYVVCGLYILFIAYLFLSSFKRKDGILLTLLVTTVFYTYMESSFAVNPVYLLCNPAFLIAMKEISCNEQKEAKYDEYLIKLAKSNITKAIAFLLIMMFVLRSISYVMRMNGDTKDRFAGFYAEKLDSIDVLMIGSSTVSTSFIPAYMWDKYGFTSYPMSSNSQRTKAIKYLIEEGLKYQDPDLIVVELRTFVASYEEQAKDEGHIRETVDNMKYSVNRVKAINALTEEFEDKYTFYFDIFKYHSNYGLLLTPSEWKKFDFADKNVLKGYELRNTQEKYREKDGNRKADAYCYNMQPIDEKQEAVLRDLLEYAQNKELNVLFVATPRDHDEIYEGNMCYIKEIINEYGFEMIDTNERFEELGFDYRYDMNDGAHTNIWGAVKVSDYIGKYIKENYLTGDIDHLESVTSDWDNAAITFYNMYENTEPVIK